MTTVLTPLTPHEVADRIRSGRAVIVDVREPEEFAVEHLPGAVCAPLSSFEQADLGLQPGREVIFMCRSGGRTGMHCDRLAARVEGPAGVLHGGLNSWKAAGLPVTTPSSDPSRTV